ncbi:hypothetical protein AMATHDRAFT_75415 [Amanita thiersii Skay4041]|uniref:BZIP domain-containing protein n=1 Tax=Amanita thiersii Skay4041 TaxID=703135 RepID=A0A2A9NIA4_9AGAR|nr:hypothetical protein AMATHDRAFT_75415 [Amanita thiersii Skay4041]
MDTYHDVAHLWDYPHPPAFTQLADDDIFSILQKQPYQPEPNHHSNSIPNPSSYVDGVNPQSISRYPLNSLTPPSEDSSPSPPQSLHDAGVGGGSSGFGMEDVHDPALKRKASDEGLEDGGPNQKSLHTLNNNRKGASAASLINRRKIAGAGPTSAKDETRLLKRKEQNRAAQRAFRERKEKHVKDLEDKVAALEAKNEQAQSENENLRDLLSRLQSENLMLKQQQQSPQQQRQPPQPSTHQSSFTFSMPRNAVNGLEMQNRHPGTDLDSPIFSSPSSASSSQTPTVLSSPASSMAPPRFTNLLDWSSMTSFDPSVLKILDEAQQPTATEGALGIDFGFGPEPGTPSNFPYTTIANNPAFFSLASTFDAQPPQNNGTLSPGSNDNSMGFGFNQLSWLNSNFPPERQFNDLIGTIGLSSNEYIANTPTSISPIAHHKDTNGVSNSSTSAASSPPELLRTPVSDTEVHVKAECPKSKNECQKAIEASGPSPFAPPTSNGNSLSAALKKTLDSNSAPIITCSGSKFPQTPKSDKNVEVLTAWRTITSNPRFKDTDINELCAEFTAKAKCDGTKVVLEPQGVEQIFEALTKK